MTYTSFEHVLDGLHERFVSVSGLPKYNEAGALVNILKYEPGAIQYTPTLYSLLDGFTRDRAGQLTIMTYRILHRLVLKWQDNAAAELALLPFVHSIPAAVDVDPTLGARITKGLARMSEGQTGFVIISNTKYRCLDFFSTVPTKGDFGSGI